MTDRETLLSLERRLASAGGADRELDYALYRGFMLPPRTAELWDSNIAVRKERLPQGYDVYSGTPKYTASVDEALALMERMLPGWQWAVGTAKGDYHAELHEELIPRDE